MQSQHNQAGGSRPKSNCGFGRNGHKIRHNELLPQADILVPVDGDFWKKLVLWPLRGLANLLFCRR
jgi:hypothetical protein